MPNTERIESLPNGQGVTFKVGDGVHWGFNGDAYPGTVRKVSKSGRQVWVSDDDHQALPRVEKKHPCDLKKNDIFLFEGHELFVVESRALNEGLEDGGRHEIVVSTEKDGAGTHQTFKVRSRDRVDVRGWWDTMRDPSRRSLHPKTLLSQSGSVTP